MNTGEFELINRIRKRFPAPEGALGIGDDCAIFPQSGGKETLVSTDLLIEGVHFLLNDISPRQLGWKAAAVNISDIAAMGGQPTATFLSIAIPDGIDELWVSRFLDGYGELSERFGVPLMGGDTTGSKSGLCINVTVLGECTSGRSVKRSGARPGDIICVTGTLGDSAAGLKAIMEGLPRDVDINYLIQKHYMPEPEVEAGLALAQMDGIGAMMDISDGIASDIRHILEESGVGARIGINSLPVSPELGRVCRLHGWDQAVLAAEGGEDYELLFTCRPGSLIPVSYTVIGEITGGDTLSWIGGDRDYQGFRHF